MRDFSRHLRLLTAAAALCAFPATEARAGLLEAKGVAVLDSGGSSRTTFTNSERISIQQRVFNGVASPNRIYFRFTIMNPAGLPVFEHTGNSTPAGVGNAASSLSGLRISKFYSGPGIYTLRANASLDASAVEQQAQFTVSAPNIILLYPPNGSRGVTEKPLTFRWSSSGATKYKVTVANNPSFYNAPFVRETSGSEPYLSYPECQTGALDCLGEGTVYYWKVEGLDAAGNELAQSNTLFDFTVSAPSSQTRDIAVKSLEVLGRAGNDITFRVTVENRGATSEMGIPLKFSLGGLPASNSPLTLPAMMGGETLQYEFTTPQPSDQGQSLAIGCVEIFDSDVPNNCKTLQITRSATSSSDPIMGSRQLSAEEVCAQVLLKLEEKGFDVKDYACSEIEGSTTLGDLQALLASLEAGTGEVTISGPAEGTGGTGGTGYVDVWTGGTGGYPGGYAEGGTSEGGAAEGGTGEEGATDGFSPTLDPENVCESLMKSLREEGYELEGYSCSDLDRSLTERDLQELLEALRSGRAAVELSGPAEPGGVTEGDFRPEGERDTSLAGSAPETPAEEDEDRTGEGLEWSGLCTATRKDAAYADIRGKRAWKKLWKRVSDQKVPELNFDRFMIVGVVAGGEDRAEKVEVSDVSETPQGLRVRYRLTKARETELAAEGKKSLKDRTPYHLKVVRRSDLKLLYERVEVSAEEAKPAPKDARKKGKGKKGRIK